MVATPASIQGSNYSDAVRTNVLRNQQTTIIQKDAGVDEDAIYLVYINHEQGLVGGAKLTPITNSQLSLKERRRMGIITENNVWECSKVFFEIEGVKTEEMYDEKYQASIQRFYKDLYEGIKVLSKEKEIKMIVTLHDQETHEDLRGKGLWPFLMEAEMGDLFFDAYEPMMIGVLNMSNRAFQNHLSSKQAKILSFARQ
jgi:hypothetical protein